MLLITLKFPLTLRLKMLFSFFTFISNILKKSLLVFELIEQSKNNKGNSSNKFILPLQLKILSEIEIFFE